MNKAIHGAFRRDLARFIDALDRFPVGNQTRARQLSAAWVNFEDQLTHHHTGEHQIAWPHLRAVGVSDELLETLDAEHDAMSAALANADHAMRALSTSAAAQDAAAAKEAVERLQAATLKHMDHEESELEPVYAAKRDTAEMKAMGREFGKVSPARGGRFFAWVSDGATPDEMAAITGNIPKPVLAVIDGVFGRGYRKNIAPVWRS